MSKRRSKKRPSPPAPRSASLLPLVPEEEYADLPEGVRALLGGVTHSDHVSWADTILARERRHHRPVVAVGFTAGHFLSHASEHDEDDPTDAVLTCYLEELAEGVAADDPWTGTASEFLEELDAASAQGDLEDTVSESDPAVISATAALAEELGAAPYGDLLSVAVRHLAALPGAATGEGLVRVSALWGEHRVEGYSHLESPHMEAAFALSLALAGQGTLTLWRETGTASALLGAPMVEVQAWNVKGCALTPLPAAAIPAGDLSHFGSPVRPVSAPEVVI